MSPPGSLLRVLIFIKHSTFVAPCSAISEPFGFQISTHVWFNVHQLSQECSPMLLSSPLSPRSSLLPGTRQAPPPPCLPSSIFSAQQDHCALEGFSRQEAILLCFLLSEIFFSLCCPLYPKLFDICLFRSKIEY